MTTIFLDSEQAEIDAVRRDCTSEELNAWFDQSAIKARFKKSCMKLQGLRCCYCQKYSNTINSSQWDLEHVLSEDDYPQFFTVDGNLAIACKKCNLAKRNQDVLVQSHPRPPVSLPSNSIHYSIPHPRIDDWAQCLSHVNYEIYKGLNDKGTELITVCRLNELAVLNGNLSYEDVVFAAKSRFFDRMGSDLPADFPEDDAIERMAQLTRDNEDALKYLQMAPLENELRKLNNKAAKRTAESAVLAAKELAARKLKKRLLDSISKCETADFEIIRKALVLTVDESAPLLIGNDKQPPGVADPEPT
ncbi:MULTISPECIES: hypothetical protein [unclassified Pseudoxanthomonas]|uniref:HNH endonuclease n=1 Tax=unclassified Pseudoxanthomonas TaxID=2645906 RepID=UPI0008E74C8F|nr:MULTISPECIES: hypothetical protein [unclassified Pseudoxanthomonas]PPJ41269.1 hypothetical protein C0063_15550 [Pseudoxanthomonas sp. KAs_5_3]SFV30777.1 hypothetical protein SAMN05428990_1792 [Pseudoxanthomonas sp. YR558]